MRVEEERVGSPRERLRSLVEVRVFRTFRQLSTVLLFDMLQMFFVLIFYISDPRETSDGCSEVAVDLLGMDSLHSLAGKQT